MTSINLKTPKEITIMKVGGQKLNSIKKALIRKAQPGTKLSDIEALAMNLINKTGGQASFAMVDGYQWATCINLNEGLVHGVPDNKTIKSGDIVSIDCGIYLKGFHTDTSFSFLVGNKKDYKDKAQKIKNRQNNKG